MGKLIHILAGLLLVPLLGAAPETAVTPAADSAAGAAPASPSVSSVSSVPAAAPTAPPSAQKVLGPSRYAGADVKGYVESLGARFAIRTRAGDPFGQIQDPDAKPVVDRTVKKIVRRGAPVTATPLSEIVGYLKISMIMPKTRRFVIDGHTLGVGDKLPLNFRSSKIVVEITEVSPSRIVFRNVETGETGVHQLDLLPQGITRGNKPEKVPGMTPLNSATALEIQVPASSPASNPNNP